MRIIFLDFDGVLNNKKYFEAQSEIVFQPFAPENVRHINTLCETYGCKIVISSEWRNFGGGLNVIEMLREADIEAQVVGATPSIPGMPRGMEIQAWLIANSNLQDVLEGWIIIDDRDDMGYIKDRLIQTNPDLGFTENDLRNAMLLFEELE